MKFRRMFDGILAVIAALTCAPHDAKATTEQVAIAIALQPIKCDGFAHPQFIFLEQWIDNLAALPNPAYISRTLFWWDGDAQINSTTVGNVTAGIDVGQQYRNTALASTAGVWLEPKYIKNIFIWEAFPGGSKLKETNFSPPVAYRSGDLIGVAPECYGGGTIKGAFIGIFFNTDAGDIPPPDPSSFLLNVPPATYGTNVGTFSMRTATTPATATFSQCRAHVTANGDVVAAIGGFTLLHQSACIQSTVTPSSCVSAPVELTYGKQSGFDYYIGQWTWSDLVPLAVSPGDTVLVTSTFSNSSTQRWPLSLSGAVHNWASVTDSWNTIDMQGTVVDQPGRAQIIDAFQCK